MALQNGTLQLLFFIILFLETIKLSSCIENEKQALLKLKQGLTDPSSRLPSWVGENCCTWSGVTCNNKTRNVIGLNLRNPLTGHELGVLDLSNNGFNTTIPHWLFNFSTLAQLDLSSNNFHGGLSRSLGKLCNLHMLKLSINEISGEYLALWNNLFKGSIPNSIGNMSCLEELYLSNNQMGGNIPQSLGQLKSLVVLELSENPWESVITEAHFANLSSLREFSIHKGFSNISVIFHISSDWLPPFKLTYITITSCQLGPKFPTWLRNQNELNTLVLVNTRISDTIPEWFWKLDLQLNELDVGFNHLRGQVPNSLRFNDLSNVDLYSNSFEGPFPLWSSNVSSLYLRNNLFSGPIPLNIGEVMPKLTDLDMAMNSLNGSIPLSIGNLNALTNLDISKNHISGRIPDFWNDMPDLYYIDMSNNRLSGTIPSSIGSINSLRFLLLSKNNLSGEVPSALQNCMVMATIDIGDNQIAGYIPAWIGERTIPPCFGNLSAMKIELNSKKTRYQAYLDVVTKGRTYECKDTNLYLVNYLDLSGNDLFGVIPEELTNLFNLGTLNLSMNHLRGTIPEKIGNLKQLETLDLSKNELSGPIPSSMASLTFLNHLNLSYNNLSGKIPTGNQLQTLIDPSIYEGNLALCGLPLTTNCSTNGGKVPNRDKEDTNDEGKFEKLWFSLTVVLGFFVGFWGVCGTLIIKKHWRDAYFDFIEKMKEMIIAVVSGNGCGKVSCGSRN
ncbi:hypothetical protein TEA_018134 [Camellia sinensis var. sinensis]|uniref:Uncharacterized protein n=1 Tax=Camellia sinensis var. sinensis TaxID=542762 RepID=A0A4S4EES3_CAMSN|nr:hypothetical protein TEA_018134 [Camellia sinensis var. sinensis]